MKSRPKEGLKTGLLRQKAISQGRVVLKSAPVRPLKEEGRKREQERRVSTGRGFFGFHAAAYRQKGKRV